MDNQQSYSDSRRAKPPKVAYLEASNDPLLRGLGAALTELETMIDLHIRSASWLVADDHYHRELEAYYVEREYLMGLITGHSRSNVSEVRQYLDTSIYAHLSKRVRALSG